MNEQSYTGGCHCGAVRYTLNADITSVMECNCSICRAAGWQLAFVQTNAFELQQGEDATTDYQFGKQHLHHPFCTTCGVRSYSWGNNEEGEKMYAVNTRCLDGFDVSDVEVNQFDGASA